MQTGKRRHVVVAGAGVAGLETVLALHALAGEHVEIDVVAPEEHFSYRPMAVAEPFRVGEVRRFPLDRLVLAAGARLRPGALAAIDADRASATLADGSTLEYDTLVLAVGARPYEAVPGALTFRGGADRAALDAVLDRATSGELRRIVFTMPAGASWPMPLYELAFLTAEYLVGHLTRGVEIVLATPEDRPLELFGIAASDAVRRLLETRGVRLETGVVPVTWDSGVLELVGGDAIESDAVVSLPRLAGAAIEGVPQNRAGFVATDELGWVLGLADVYAAGDVTTSSIKQGGIAAQQADSVASAVAADAGAAVRPVAFKPVLRGLLLTGMAPRFLRAEGGTGRPSVIDTQPLWWPPAKIVGRHLSPFLAARLGLAAGYDEPPHGDAVAVDVALDTRDHAAWSSI